MARFSHNMLYISYNADIGRSPDCYELEDTFVDA